MDFRKYLEMFPTGVRLQHFRSWCARSSSNSYNFFVSTPNRAPFEAMESWLPKIWIYIWYAWNELWELIKMCPMGLQLWHVCSWCARWKILRHGDFTTISQLRNECKGLRNSTHVPKGGFTTAKHPSEWLIGCEMEDFQGMEVLQPFRSCETSVRACEMALVCQGTFSQLRKFS